MKVLHTVAGLWEGTGGPVASITSLCGELARRGHDVCLLTGRGAVHPDVNRQGDRVRVRLEALGPYGCAHWSSAFRRACREEAHRVDVIHDHGVWLHTNWASAWAAREATRPLIRSPRGMLSPWALSRSRLRKRILWRLVERKLFAASAVIHATSRLEQDELRALGVPTRVEVIANGIDTDGEYSASRVEAARVSACRSVDARRRIVFLSRLHAKKGLDLLREAWSSLPSGPPAELVVAGDGVPQAVSEVEQWAARENSRPVRYVGSVTGEAKLGLLAGAWTLVLPSHSENYGMAVAEALACGVPVVTTTATPWQDVEESSCGRVVEPEAPALARALHEMIALGVDDRAAMGRKARSLIEEHHSLKAAGSRFEALYADLRSRHRGMFA